MIGSLSIYLLPLASLGCPWDAIGLLWPDFGLPFASFGSHWGTLKLPLAVLWPAFGVALALFGSCGIPLGRLGLSPSNFKLNVHRLRCLSTKSSLLEHATGATGATGAMGTSEVVSRTAARSPPPTRAGDQDDGSYTNSLK